LPPGDTRTSPEASSTAIESPRHRVLRRALAERAEEGNEASRRKAEARMVCTLMVLPAGLLLRCMDGFCTWRLVVVVYESCGIILGPIPIPPSATRKYTVAVWNGQIKFTVACKKQN